PVHDLRVLDPAVPLERLRQLLRHRLIQQRHTQVKITEILDFAQELVTRHSRRRVALDFSKGDMISIVVDETPTQGPHAGNQHAETNNRPHYSRKRLKCVPAHWRIPSRSPNQEFPVEMHAAVFSNLGLNQVDQS